MVISVKNNRHHLPLLGNISLTRKTNISDGFIKSCSIMDVTLYLPNPPTPPSLSLAFQIDKNILLKFKVYFGPKILWDPLGGAGAKAAPGIWKGPLPDVTATQSFSSSSVCPSICPFVCPPSSSA